MRWQARVDVNLEGEAHHAAFGFTTERSSSIDGGGDVLPVFILDPHFTRSGRVGSARMTFLFDTLADLHSNLQKRSSLLFCVQGSPDSALPQLFKQWNITRLAYEYDGEPYAKSRDQRIAELAASHGVDVVVTHGHTLHAPRDLLAACGGAMPKSYGSFVSAVERLAVAPEIASPSSIKTPAKLWLADVHAVCEH
jgi:deoxyribodipyrimidine photolyase